MRRCTVCDHAKVDQINEALVEGQVAIAHLSAQFKVTRFSLYRHAVEHVPKHLARSRVARQQLTADSLIPKLQLGEERMQKLWEALEEVIQGSDGKYSFLTQAANNIMVAYQVNSLETGTPQTIQVPLDELLLGIQEQTDLTIQRFSVRTKPLDPFTAALRIQERVDRILELYARLIGELQQRVEISLDSGPVASFVSLVISELGLGEDPETLEKIQAMYEEATHGQD